MPEYRVDITESAEFQNQTAADRLLDDATNVIYSTWKKYLCATRLWMMKYSPAVASVLFPLTIL
jgi:hypothetical protein